MKEKIVFFDIDGTLLDHDKKLPATTKEAIEQLTQNGIHVAIATGRAPFMFEDLRKELGITTFVSFNGQYVVFEDKVIYKNPLNKNALTHLFEYSKEHSHPLVFMDEKTMKASVENHPYVHESMGSLFFNHPDMDPEYFRDNEIYQTLLFCENHEEHLYVPRYKEFHFIRWHNFSTDIIPDGGSKAIGIQKLIERLSIDRENVYAFGDGLNDSEMLQFAGTGVAMGNAKDEIKKVADVVTKDVDQDGILHGLELLGLVK